MVNILRRCTRIRHNVLLWELAKRYDYTFRPTCILVLDLKVKSRSSRSQITKTYILLGGLVLKLEFVRMPTSQVSRPVIFLMFEIFQQDRLVVLWLYSVVQETRTDNWNPSPRITKLASFSRICCGNFGAFVVYFNFWKNGQSQIMYASTRHR